MPLYTLQQAFDIAALGMLNQGEKSRNHTGTCMYRGDHGRKCAVGFLIPDELYQKCFDSGVELADINDFVDIVGEGEYYQFLARMQETHDAYRVPEWSKQLKYVAKLFNLNDDVVTKWEKENGRA